MLLEAKYGLEIGRMVQETYSDIRLFSGWGTAGNAQTK